MSKAEDGLLKFPTDSYFVTFTERASFIIRQFKWLNVSVVKVCLGSNNLQHIIMAKASISRLMTMSGGHVL